MYVRVRMIGCMCATASMSGVAILNTNKTLSRLVSRVVGSHDTFSICRLVFQSLNLIPYFTFLLSVCSNDRALLERCLSTSNNSVIANTVARIVPMDAALFLKVRVRRWKQGVCHPLDGWGCELLL